MAIRVPEYPNLEVLLLLVSHDNDIPIDLASFNWPADVESLEEQAQQLSPGARKILAIGEEQSMRAIVKKYRCAGLHSFLNDFFQCA